MTSVRRMAYLSIATSIATLALKFTAYALTGSVSLWSDALESFVNLAAGLVALGALTLAARPADARHTYGHDKAEYFSCGVEGTLILVAAISIIVSAIGRLMDPKPLEEPGIGLAIALAAAGMNYVTARLMMRAARTHESITLEADAKHLLTDVWTSVGIVTGLLVVAAAPGLTMLDALMAIAVGVHIIATGIDLVRRAVDGLMDAALSPAETARAEAIIRAALTPDATYHALRTRRAGAVRFIELHLLVPGSTPVDEAHALCDRIEAELCAHFRRVQVTIHVEPRESQLPHG